MHRSILRLTLSTEKRNEISSNNNNSIVREPDNDECAAIPDQAALKSRAEAELTMVTAEVDQANILFSPVDDCDGPNYAKVVQYHREYVVGR